MLLAQWAATRRDLAAALSFDRIAGTRELAALLVEPLGTLEPALLDLPLLSGEIAEPAMGDEFVARLVGVYDALPEMVLVIDGFDELEPSSLRQDVLTFIAQTAPHIHFVAAIRSQAAVPQIARDIELANDVAYLRESDLLFDYDEARDLLLRESRRRLDDADVSALVERTEGWAVGLHLAALSLRAAEDVAGWVDGFGGADEYVASYFTDVVMPQQSEEMQVFLLTTSVLDRLNGPLCDAVTGATDGMTMLHLLGDRSTLRRKPGTDTFVHHRLFREYLRSRFHSTDPQGVKQVLGRAADWHLEHENVEEAVRYLIAAHDWERVLDAVATAGRGMYEQGRPAVALAWVEAVPPAVRESRHEVMLQHAVLRAMAGESLGAEEILRRLGDPRSLPPGVRAVAETLRSSWVEAHLAPDAVIEAADNALAILDTLRADELPDVFGITSARDDRVMASASKARAIWYLGDVGMARVALEGLLEDGEMYRAWRLNILGTLALLEAWNGRFGIAEQYATYAFRIAGESRQTEVHPSLVNAYLAMAHVALERNDPQRAELVLGEAFDATIRASRFPMSLALHAVERAHLELSYARPRAALECLRETEKGQPRLPPLIGSRLRALKARALLGLGEPKLAERALDLDVVEPTVEVAATAVQLALARNDAVTGRQILASWPRDGGSWSDLNCALAQALVDDAEGNRRESLDGMAEALAAAEPEGHVLLFLDAGPRAQRLLRALFHARPTSYLRQLVRPEQAAPPVIGPATSELRTPLSERELLVLRYLPSRMTHAEIAAQLFVSVNTVKTQVRSIYTKLGARGRKDAIDRAEELGLV